MLTAILLSVGITHVWARGTIFKRARALYPALLDCPLCAGVWISFFVQLGLWLVPTLTIAIGVACVSASASLAVYGLIRAIPVRSTQTTTNEPVDNIERIKLGLGVKPYQSNEDAAWEAGKGRGYT